MRNPQRWRKVDPAFLGSGDFAALAPFLLPPAFAGDGLRTASFAYGITAIIFGALAALTAHFDAQAQDALLRGDDVVARWRVDAQTWQAFIALNSRLNQEPDALINELSIRDAVPEQGIAIIVGKTAVQIDESIHRLPRRGTP